MNRILATYRVAGDRLQSAALAREMAVELTVEVPESLIDRYPRIASEIVAEVRHVEELAPGIQQVTLALNGDLARSNLNQLLNLLLGNCSMMTSVQLTRLELPDEVLGRYSGPRHSIEGVRKLTGVVDRPLVATALKPRGAPLSDLVNICREFTIGGGDLIKDDHNLIDDDLDQFRDRVERCTAAIREEQGDRHRLYLVNLIAPSEQLDARMEIALEAGADGALLAPWVIGLDRVRELTGRWPAVYLGHPSMSGVLTSGSGIAAPIVHGTLARLAGLDGSVFVNSGGRFPLTRPQGREIAEALRCPLAGVARGWAVPAGGMRPEGLPELVEDFGPETMLLMGGAILVSELGIAAETARIRQLLRQQFSSHLKE
ncbi:MAG: RuBisCO large subunit C-terminal-like domain-containing protein [Planctomycetota bacterium]|nr:RuBisCO large subunit C-terminal-like domain-containing protein [Planctomycetota bacterium]